MKTKLFKRLTAAALALLMVAASVPSGSDFSQLFTGSGIVASAQTDSGKCGVNATWEYDSETGKLTIGGSGAMYDYNNSDNKAPWYDYRNNIESVEIASGITRTGDWAFYNLDHALELSFGNNSQLKTIGESSFYGGRYRSITIPASVEVIEEYAFGNLDYIHLTISFEDGSQLKTIGDHAFDTCKCLSTITIPSTVTSIGEMAFGGCRDLSDIYLSSDPSGLTWNVDENESDNFKPNKGTKCHVPVEYLSAYKAKFAKGEDTDINVTFVGFGKCGDNAIWELDEKAGKLTISGTGDMWDYKFNYTSSAPGTPWYDYREGIKTVEISEGITTVGTMAFYSLTELTSVSIPSTVMKIKGYAFSYCRYLSSLTFAGKSKLEFIGDHSFVSVKLTDIVLPEGVTTIEYSAFGNCSSIKSVTLPSTISSIDVYAFAHCRNLDNIYIYSDPSKLTWNADQNESGNFKPNKGTKCHVPVEYLSAYKAKYARSSNSDINVTFACDNQCGDNAWYEFDNQTGKLTIGGTGAMYDYIFDTEVSSVRE